MADSVILNNYSDDSQIKRYISEVLMPRVFHDIPINILNTGQFSLINEYMSQAIENLAFTSSFYFNESFITKAMLADSIYSEAAIFNIGYSFATPSACNFMLELKIEDLIKNATFNSDNGLYEFILDKNTKFNLKNGSIYSLDYDILIQYKNVETATISKATVPAWNVQYTNMDESNVVAINRNPYILYRVSETWLCLFLQTSEFERETHIVVNNMTNGIPNADKTIDCLNHIAGFDVKYIDGDGNEQYLDRDHILPIHSDVKDQQPYVHYIMDSPKTIRFMFQLNGTRYFVPKLNSSYEITVYTCHGESANFTAFKDTEQPSVITSSNKYSNNGNVMKTAVVISGSMGGTNIGTIETTRRETIEAYNTANVISSDHDIYEWFKTFFFKNVLYPFFFKRRDDPWGRIWSGFIALKDESDSTVFRTNTVHAKIPYRTLYKNVDNIIGDNEIIIPPGFVWVYTKGSDGRYTVEPYVSNNNQIETAKTALRIDEPFAFANPFGIRIQKDPFAIGYFNPWINEYATASIIPSTYQYNTELDSDDNSVIYHATPMVVNIKRTYQNDYYVLTALVSPTTDGDMLTGESFVPYLRVNTEEPNFSQIMWNYFKKPADLFAAQIPILVQQEDDQYIVFNPEKTFLCVRNRTNAATNKWILTDYWIEDRTTDETKIVKLPMSGFKNVFGNDAVWGSSGICMQENNKVMVSGNTDIDIYPTLPDDAPFKFERIAAQNYYELRIKDDDKRVIESIRTAEIHETQLTKFGETQLWRIGQSYPTSVTVEIRMTTGEVYTLMIRNPANVYTPYEFTYRSGDDESTDDTWVLDQNNNITSGMIILYADMKPMPSEVAVDYYRVPLSAIGADEPIFYLTSSQLPVELNEMRVVLEAKINGATTGRIEMQPVQIESDGSIRFETIMYPLNKMVDVDNRIRFASVDHGGGSWIPSVANGTVSVDASDPEFQMSILFRSDDSQRETEIADDESYTGFRVSDRWNLDDISLVQELKEMRSVVNFGEYKIPTQSQLESYDLLSNMTKYDSDKDNLYTLMQYVYHIVTNTTDDSGMTFEDAQRLIQQILADIDSIIAVYSGRWLIKKVYIADPGDNYAVNNIRIILPDGTVSRESFVAFGGKRLADGTKVAGPVWDIQNRMVNDGTQSRQYGLEPNENHTMDYEITSNLSGVGLSTILADTDINSSGAVPSGLTVTIKPEDVVKVSSIPNIKEGLILDLINMLHVITNAPFEDDINWDRLWELLNGWNSAIDEMFEQTAVNSAMEIQLMPVVQSSLMNSDKFETFVSAFTQVHKAIEPVIFRRLEGNNYLDCKLIATYGYPHSYASDIDKSLYEKGSITDPNEVNTLFWPSLDVQIEFDIKLFNPAMETITLNEVRSIIKSYFNRLTSIHTPLDMISMDNNIYISQLIQQLEEHPNVAYLKFKGWYTDEKGIKGGKYMNADYQCIVQMWDNIEDFPKKELERFVPEMFVLDDVNIRLNII